MYQGGFAGFGTLYSFLKLHVCCQNEILGFTNISFVSVFPPLLNSLLYFHIKPDDAVGSKACWITKDVL